MPFKCSVPNCRGNYDEFNKVHVFSFPADIDLKMAWEKAIPRKNFVYTKNSKVIEFNCSFFNILLYNFKCFQSIMC